MADETMQAAQEGGQPQGDAADWQAKYEAMRQHSRDWEKKAKENQGAADELEKLRAEQMTEQEKATARAEKAEAELAQMQAESQRIQAAQQTAEKEGVPLELLMYVGSAEQMDDFAKALKKAMPEIHAAPKAASQRIVRSDGAKRTSGDVFAETVAPLFKH